MRLNERIGQARKVKGFTQQELADLAAVTLRTIQRVETGANVPRSHTLKAIAKALDLPYEALITEEASQSPVTTEQQSDDVTHFLKMLNLSCFSYIIVPYVHFLIPSFLLKKRRNLDKNATALSTKIIRQQMYWVVALHVSLLFMLSFNYMQVTIFDNRQYIVNYLWPFIAMYFLNAGVILYNTFLIRRQYKQIDCQSLSQD